MATLLRQTDLLVTLSTSGTLWNEALALGVPLVAYANPAFTKLKTQYRDDLSRACIVCANETELAAIVRHVAAEGRSFLTRFAVKSSAAFLRDYVFAGGGSAQAVVRLLAEIRAVPAPVVSSQPLGGRDR
jgi:hypothetical protein